MCFALAKFSSVTRPEATAKGPLNDIVADNMFFILKGHSSVHGTATLAMTIVQGTKGRFALNLSERTPGDAGRKRHFGRQAVMAATRIEAPVSRKHLLLGVAEFIPEKPFTHSYVSLAPQRKSRKPEPLLRSSATQRHMGASARETRLHANRAPNSPFKVVDKLTPWLRKRNITDTGLAPLYPCIGPEDPIIFSRSIRLMLSPLRKTHHDFFNEKTKTILQRLTA
ncbi:unnamed protein product [Zymoseptoria tritici ST99CH_1A5]|uniref:Uncharacterized protein n=1 Tax=Zymoseptoria tritici ST99CH_1A5 TaxID=1276529 RepID=A0A1Y6M0Q7_ZYMTR|nr:unnamed protein product [Zymoseptoria tritici ST99CH_1A5]